MVRQTNESRLLDKIEQLQVVVEEQRRVIDAITDVYNDDVMKGLDILSKVRAIDTFKEEHNCSDEQACRVFNISRMTLFRYRKSLENPDEDISVVGTSLQKQDGTQQKVFLKYLTPVADDYLLQYSSIINVVYFFYNKNNDILYIGRTNNFCTRWKYHCGSSKPMHEVTEVKVNVFDTKQEVYFYEMQKIAELNPLWNKAILSTTVSVYNILPRDVHSFVCKITEK